MKTIYEKLCMVISNLDVNCETLNALRKGMQTAMPRVPVDNYYKILLAFERVREAIEILRGMIKETKNATPTT